MSETSHRRIAMDNMDALDRIHCKGVPSLAVLSIVSKVSLVFSR